MPPFSIATASNLAIPAKPTSLPRWFVTLAAYALAAVALRGVAFGYPAIHIDEQFYLLVGDRLLGGAVPYVDIWDRKPVGLFLLYAAMRALGGDGIVQYQVVATLFAAATACIVHQLARALAGPRGAWWAGLAYLLYLSAFNCFGGQAPVFYNLLVALAAWLLVTAPPARLLATGAAAMALIGVALQLKYTVVFEGFGFGLFLLARGRALGWRRARLVQAGLLWAGCAWAPTLLAFAVYAGMGHAREFVFANFTSILLRTESLPGSLWRLAKEAAALAPMGLAVLAGLRIASAQGAEKLPFLRYWAICAVAGFLLFGTWYDHYVAPLLAPLAVLAAPAFERGRRHAALALGFGLVAAIYMTAHQLGNRGSRAEFAAMAGLIRQELHGGCAYLNEGDPILYHLSGACLATRWPFPTHLAGQVEARALGVSVDDEIASIIARRPRVIVIAAQPIARPPNLDSRAHLLRGLERAYQPYAQARVGNHAYILYRPKPD